jgi:hypothetical protein
VVEVGTKGVASKQFKLISTVAVGCTPPQRQPLPAGAERVLNDSGVEVRPVHVLHPPVIIVKPAPHESIVEGGCFVTVIVVVLILGLQIAIT